MKDHRNGRQSVPRRLAKLAAEGFLSLVAAEATLTVGLQAASALRRRFKGDPKEGFPRGDWPEIELESGDERLKLYAASPQPREAARCGARRRSRRDR